MPGRVSAFVGDLAVPVRDCADGASLLLGRSADCDLVLPHTSVSRHHARLSLDARGTAVIEDLGSKNGLRVDGARVERAMLDRRQWFAVGDVYCEFVPLGGQEAAQAHRRGADLRRRSTQWSTRLSRSRHAGELLQALLEGIVDLSECRRGYVLLARGRAAPEVVARHALSPEEIGGGEFAGSRSAVQRCLAERRAVFLSNYADRAFLQRQPSVVGAGLRALACLPLLHDGELLGAVYADTDDESRVFTELDAELLAAFAEQASAALALGAIGDDLARLQAALDGARGDAAP